MYIMNHVTCAFSRFNTEFKKTHITYGFFKEGLHNDLFQLECSWYHAC